MAFSEPFVNRSQQYVRFPHVALIVQERGSWRRAAPTISLETISEACGLAGTVV
jgi:hypothetical protein